MILCQERILIFSRGCELGAFAGAEAISCLGVIQRFEGPAPSAALLAAGGLTRRRFSGYFVSTRERRLIQPMQKDCSSCFVREVTEA
jgi:hypothetical protein